MHSEVQPEPLEHAGRRLLWPWFAGSGLALAVVVGLVLWWIAATKKPGEVSSGAEPRTATLADFVGKWESDPISLSIEADGKCFCASKIAVGNSGLVNHEFVNKRIRQQDGEFIIEIQKIRWTLRVNESKDTLVLQVKGDATVSPKQVVLTKK